MKHQKQIRSIFDQLKVHPQDNEIRTEDFIIRCAKTGILKDDPRIESVLSNFERMPDQIDFLQLCFCLKGERLRPNPNLFFYKKIINSDLLIQEFGTFSDEIDKLYKACKDN